jgi:hypothetical protein
MKKNRNCLIAQHIILLIGLLFVTPRINAGGDHGGGGGEAVQHHVVAEDPVKTQAQIAAEMESERLRILGKQKIIRYGDKVQLLHKETFRALNSHSDKYGESQRSKINARDYGNGDHWQLWIVKGKHKRGDRWNCSFGEPVKNGDVIRLENVQTKENLTTSRKYPAPITRENVEVGTEGSDGLGSSADNWEIQVQGGSEWKWGALVTLINIDSNHVLYSQDVGFLNGQEVCARKSERRREARTAQTPLSEANQAVAKMNADMQAKTDEHLNKAGGSASDSNTNASVSPEPIQARWWVIFADETPPPEEDIAWTGAPYGSEADKGEWEMIKLEIVKLGMGGGIPPRATQDFNALSADKRPRLSGFAKDEISNFDSGFLLNVNPLLNKGAAWLGTSLKTPGKATVMFKAKAEDRGDIQILFAKDIGIDFAWKIRIGGWNNTKSAIIKRRFTGGAPTDEMVVEVPQKQNPLATTQPGTYVPYWVSIDNGLVLVGFGDEPGKNVFMSWRDPQPPENIRRVGFGSDRSPVTYAEVQVRPPIDVKDPQRIYREGKESYNAVTTPDAFEWTEHPLRVPGKGALSFDIQGSKEAVVALAESQDGSGERYEIAFGADDNFAVRIDRIEDGIKKTIASTSTKDYPAAQLDSSSWKKFWLSCHDGQIIVGRGKIGKNIIMVTTDIYPLLDIKEIGFGAHGQAPASFKDVAVASPAELSVAQKKESYRRELKRFEYKGAVYIVLPFEYEIDQEGQSVKFVDKINNKTFYPGATPQQDAKYFFMITVEANGFPNLTWLTEPENPRKLEKEQAAYVSRALVDALMQASMSVAGSGMVGGLIGTAASVALAGTAAGIAGNETAKKEAALQKYRDHNSYVFTDSFDPDKLGSSSIPPEAQTNQLEAKQKIELAGKWKPSSPDKFERLVSIYQQVIYLVTHPHVVSSQYIKKSIFDNIASLYNARKTLYPGLAYEGAQSAYNSLMNLLITAQNNTYLVNPDDPDELKQKDIWYTWINELARDLLAGNGETPIELQPYFGEYIWLNNTLPVPDQGTILFEARAINDVFVAFGKMPFKTRNSPNEIYEVVIGGWSNSKTAVRVHSLDRAVAQIERSSHPEAMLNPLNFKRFWLSVNQGTITLGTDEIKQENIVLTWQDPYPIQKLKYVGLSTWNAPANFRNIHIGPDLEKAIKEGWDPLKEVTTPEPSDEPATPKDGEYDDPIDLLMDLHSNLSSITPSSENETVQEALLKKAASIAKTMNLKPTELAAITKLIEDVSAQALSQTKDFAQGITLFGSLIDSLFNPEAAQPKSPKQPDKPAAKTAANSTPAPSAREKEPKEKSAPKNISPSNTDSTPQANNEAVTDNPGAKASDNIARPEDAIESNVEEELPSEDEEPEEEVNETEVPNETVAETSGEKTPDNITAPEDAIENNVEEELPSEDEEPEEEVNEADIDTASDEEELANPPAS